MRAFYELHKKPINQTLVFVLSLIGISLIFKYVLVYFAPFILAFFLAAIISRPVDLLSNKTRIPRAVSTVFSMLVIISAIIATVNFASRLLLTQLVSFVSTFPDTLDKVTVMLLNFQESYYDFFEFFPTDIRDFIDQAIITTVSTLTKWIGNGAKSFSVSAVKVIPKMFIFILMTLIATFFMTKDKQKINAFLGKQIPNNIGNTYNILKKDIFGAIWGYIRAQLILMSFSGCIAIIGLTFLRYEYSLLIGLTIAFFDALPIFGSGFILWPWAAVNFIAGNYSFAVALLAIYGTITVNRQMLEPKILSSQIGLHPLVTLMALYIGLMLLGPIGLICGPLFAIIIRSLQNVDLLPNWK